MVSATDEEVHVGEVGFPQRGKEGVQKLRQRPVSDTKAG